MKKINIHQINFEVKRNGITLFKTEPVAFGSPVEKEVAGSFLKVLKEIFNDHNCSISKYITDIEVREYSVK